LGTVAEVELALTVLFVGLIVTSEMLSVGPLEDTKSVHHIVLPPSLVDAVVLPNEDPLPFELVVPEVSLIGALVGPFKTSRLLGASKEIASEDSSVRPVFLSRPVL
jgi:hypothetical protein